MFRLAHMSDPHLPPPERAWPISDLLNKRALSRLAWRRKRRQHDPAVLARITADIAAYAPDHLAITGDLTNFSTAEEIGAACVWLKTLGPNEAITVSPGNHDALVRTGAEACAQALGPWFGDQADGEFPFVRRRGPVAIINLRSAAPTLPLLASGRLGQAQLQRLRQALETLGREGLFRVVMLHHPATARVVSRRKALDDRPALQEVLRKAGAELVLHGHAHETVFASTPGPNGPIPVLATPSASMPAGRPHAPARWHALEIEADGTVQVIARGLSGPDAEVAELGRYRLVPALSDSAS